MLDVCCDFPSVRCPIFKKINGSTTARRALALPLIFQKSDIARSGDRNRRPHRHSAGA